jgi:type IV secretion system protein VirD4
LTLFADAVADAATSADDFKLEDVRRRRMSVYVRIPPNRLANARPLMNLFFSQLVSLNTQALPEQDPTLKVRCLLVNDEFTAMGRVGVITNAAAFLAGYILRLLTVRADDVAARCRLRRQGGPHLRHQPQSADPLRAA